MKIRATFETETYISQGGYFVIRQIDSLGEESLVMLSPGQMQLLVDDMKATIQDSSWWSDAIAEE